MVSPRATSLPSRGFTLPELLISLTITLLMSVCIAAMVRSVSAGTTGQQDGRRHLARTQSLQTVLTSQVHGCVNFLAVGSNYLVYWIGDANNNLAVDSNELGMIEYQSSSNQLYLWTPAAGASSTTYAANSNWYSICTAAKNGALSGKPIAGNVTAFSVTLSHATPGLARMASFTITLDDGVVSRTVVIAGSMRTYLAPQ